ncbi:MAG: sterol desaturase family protein [Halioglobus sp.]
MQASSNIIEGHGVLIGWLIANQELTLLLVTFGGMLLLLTAEQIWPRRHSGESQSVRWVNNWLLAAFNFFALVFATLALSNSAWLPSITPQTSVFADLPAPVAFVLLLVAFEAVNYVQHRLFHAVPWLWRVHAVHHSDPWVDVTTSHRHHLIEVLITNAVMLPLVLLAGVPVTLFVIAMLTRLAIILVNHSNLAVPRWLDTVLRPFVVTPDFHRIHHSSEQALTDSNFGTVLPLFDYLFGSARSVPWQAQGGLRCGLHAWREPGDSRLDKLLMLPLMWQAAEAGQAEPAITAKPPADPAQSTAK